MPPSRALGSFALCVALLGCGASPASTPTADVLSADLTAADATAPTADTGELDAAMAVDGSMGVEDLPSVSDAPVVAPAYPEGPYGSREGSVLANLAWEGYVNTRGESRSTMLEFGPTTLQDLRGDGRGYALIHLAEFL